ncbi:hypothetical protein GIB67_022027 [Kingdonia uniflora]|uniref:Apoptosis inhibitor 5 n=1 Tax=Kingdonia uniflora TaxID=39325 RepID=A0A7J7MUH6_9MAGN|nr:hypothetical protein GIB67_022027 [Kingdonia uniflora]
MADASDDSSEINKLYEYGNRLNASKDKSQNLEDYIGVIKAARGSIKAKQLAAQLIPKYFKFFPTLANQAANAHFDLCEEEELGVKTFRRLFAYPFHPDVEEQLVSIWVRVQAIRGLPFICKDTPEVVEKDAPNLVSKIVDVLGQLLTAEENVERDAVHKALMSLLRQDVEAALTALFKHLEPSADDTIREKVLNFIRDKVFPQKAELLRPREQMERHLTDLVKKCLQDVTGAEFKLFMDLLNGLSIFGEGTPPERVQELIEIIEGQADLDAQFIVEDVDHIDRLLTCLCMALPYFMRGASNSKFVNYLNKNILPAFDQGHEAKFCVFGFYFCAQCDVVSVLLRMKDFFPQLPEERRKLDLLKSLAESSDYITPQDSRQLLPSVVQLLKKCMARRKTGEDYNFDFVECLLYTFHHLSHKTPNATNSLCGYKIVTGQPSDRLGEDFSDCYKEFTERLTNAEDLTRATMKRLTQGMAEHNKAMAAAKTEADNEIIKTKKQNTTKGLRTCNNILAMTQPLHSKTPSFIGDKKINLSWKETVKLSTPSTAAMAGGKRTATTFNGSSNTGNKKGRDNGTVQSQLVNRALEGISHGGGRGSSRGGRWRGRGRGRKF